MLTKADSTGTASYTWDFENRLTSVTLPGTGGTASFKYDPAGRRIQKLFTSGTTPPTTITTIYAYDGDNLIEEVDSNGNVLARYSHGQNVDEPLAVLRSGTTSYYHADGLNSVTSLSNGAGAVAQTYTFDSFGKQTASSGSLTNPFRYTGREFDPETSLYYYRARYYDPQTGRFLSEDRLRSVSSALNFYSYVENSAPNLIDRSVFCPADPSGDKSKCPGGKPDPSFRLVPISDCSRPGQRRIYYELQGPAGSSPSCWWVTEHVNPPGWAPKAKGSPEGQSTNDEPGIFDDGLYGLNAGQSTQAFTISPQDPRAFPSTPSFPVIVRVPGPNGQPQDFGKLAHNHQGGQKLHCINGNCTGWVPCLGGDYDVPGFGH